MKHHEGELGIFDYDETQFKVFMDGKICYIGEETDGSKIVIPDGVVDLSETFRDSCLETPPKIPESVVSCTNTFYDCDCLTQAAELPEGVLVTKNMYHGCSSLKSAGRIPTSVGNCKGMFFGCIQLKEAAVFEPTPECNRRLMYCRCVNLEKVYDVECSEQTEKMYSFCFNLRLSEEQVQQLSSVETLALARTFPNCTGLLKHYFVPIVLDGVLRVVDLYADEVGLTEQEAFKEWILPFAEYGLLPDYSEDDLMKLNCRNLSIELKGQTVAQAFKQQADLYKKPSSKSSTGLKCLNVF